MAAARAEGGALLAAQPVVLAALLWRAWAQAPAGVEVSAAAELAAAAAVLLLLGPFLLPVPALLLWCLMGPGRVGAWLLPRGTAERCAVWLLWNTPVLAMSTMALLVRLLLPLSSYLAVLRVWALFFVSVPCPIILMTGGLKVLAGKLRSSGAGAYGRKQQVFQAALMAPATLLLWRWAAAVLPSRELAALLVMTVLYYLYISVTNAYEPEVTGRRRWPSVHDCRELWALATSYFSMEVVFDGREAERWSALGPADRAARALGVGPGAKKGCIIGYHPHGIIPYTAGLMLLHPSWEAVLPCSLVDFMTDGFTHAVPLMRDLIQWLGAREVTKEAIGRALGAGRSALLVPGGQAEIATTRSWGSEVFMDRRHKGFVRMSLEEGVPLVPVLSMGEWTLMDNVSFPRIQALSRRVLGFPFPFVPYGAMPFMPRRRAIILIVGEPQACPPRGNCVLTLEEVDEQHRRYFEQLEGMFERHKGPCGFPEARIRWL